MKIYVNEQYEIIALDVEPENYSHLFEVERTRIEMFGDLCDSCIQGYKYEPQYEMLFNKDGTNARNEKTGELLYKLDESGHKNFIGYACYPFIDYKMLTLIQKQYEESSKQLLVLSARMAYLSMMAGIEMEAGHE